MCAQGRGTGEESWWDCNMNISETVSIGPKLRSQLSTDVAADEYAGGDDDDDDDDGALCSSEEVEEEVDDSPALL